MNYHLFAAALTLSLVLSSAIRAHTNKAQTVKARENRTVIRKGDTTIIETPSGTQVFIYVDRLPQFQGGTRQPRRSHMLSPAAARSGNDTNRSPGPGKRAKLSSKRLRQSKLSSIGSNKSVS